MGKKQKNDKDKFSTIITAVKLGGWIGLIVGCVLSVTIIVCSTSYVLDVANSPISELKQDEVLMDYTSMINSYSYSETIEVFSNITDHFEFALIELVLPSIILLFGSILITIAFKNLLTLVKNVKTPKDLFTDKKHQIVISGLGLSSIALLFISKFNFFLWIAIICVFELFEFVFGYCTKLHKN